MPGRLHTDQWDNLQQSGGFEIANEWYMVGINNWRGKTPAYILYAASTQSPLPVIL